MSLLEDARARVSSAFAGMSLRRIVTSNRFIPEVDGFRFAAIWIVILSHMYGQCGPMPVQGWFPSLLYRGLSDGRRGVYLFFTISGFILALPFARHALEEGKAVALGAYFRRRLTRLEPPYVLAMLGRTILIRLVKRTAIGVLLLHLLASLFYVHNVVYHQDSIINPPAWSLEIEVQFYLLAPLLTRLIFGIRHKLARRALLVGLILGSGGLSTWLIPALSPLSLTLLMFLQYFLAGFLLCDLYLCKDVWKLNGWVWDAVGVLALGWSLYARWRWYPVVLPFAALALYLSGFQGKLVRGFFRWRPVSLLGGMCYSIYLTHTTVLTAVTPLVQQVARLRLPTSLELLGMFAVGAVPAVLAGAVYFVAIERPCMDPAWPQKLWSRVRRSS